MSPSPRNYYNDFDPAACQWLRNLITAGLLPAGDVDERSIDDVTAGDLRGYTACHFFAGIGGWPLALQIAGWPASAPVWTGSCPCQPFSAAGRGKAQTDSRHLVRGQCLPKPKGGKTLIPPLAAEFVRAYMAHLTTLAQGAT